MANCEAASQADQLPPLPPHSATIVSDAREPTSATQVDPEAQLPPPSPPPPPTDDPPANFLEKVVPVVLQLSLSAGMVALGGPAVWNHDFFWESMQPNGGRLPWGGVLDQIEKDFGSFSDFRDEFVHSAMMVFGSGWVWLVLKTNERRLSIVRTSNAVCPLVWGDIPIISLDMREHAYYLDYEGDVSKYVNNFMDHLVSWHSATARMVRAEAFVNLGEPKIPVA